MDALVFATDETFASLAKGLVLSLEGTDMQLCLVDIGCSPATIEWMKQRNVAIGKFEKSRFKIPTKEKLKPYQDAQLCRPFLPEIFQGFEVYVWADSDLWIQNISAIDLYRQIARSNPGKIPLSPLIDISYEFFYKNGAEFVSHNYVWFSDVYGPTMASTYGPRAVLNSGLFALHRESPIWTAWTEEMKHIFNHQYQYRESLHVAEQVALNYLAFAHEALVPMEATTNYNCHVGMAKRDDSGRVVIDIPPFREIDVVHLTYSSRMMSNYIDNGLLFDKGSYLDDGEIQRLRGLSHY